jgi:hypothetical protein
MSLSKSAVAVIRLGIVTLMAAAAASAWELLALQAPGSPVHIGMLPGPIAALRELCIVLGLLQLGTGLLLPWANLPREPRISIALLHVGTLLAVAAQLYGAALGMSGVQLLDLRPDALPLFIARQGGLGLCVVALLGLGRAMLQRLVAASAGVRRTDPRPVARQPDGIGAAERNPPVSRQLDPEERGH